MSNSFKASTNVEIIEEMIAAYIFIFAKHNIISIDVIKKVIEPSSDLFKNFTAPCLLPINAANESEILIINRATIEISLGKNIMVSVDDNNT